MAGTEQVEALQRGLQTVLADLVQIEPESLVRTEVLGQELNFEAGTQVFRRTIGLFKELAQCIRADIPDEKLREITNIAHQTLETLRKIQAFSIKELRTIPRTPRTHGTGSSERRAEGGPPAIPSFRR